MRRGAQTGRKSSGRLGAQEVAGGRESEALLRPKALPNVRPSGMLLALMIGIAFWSTIGSLAYLAWFLLQ